MEPNSFRNHLSSSGSKLNRRDFIKGLGGIGITPGLGSGLLAALSAQGIASTNSGAESPIFVLIHQAGGNDTLNTVIPIDTSDSSHYYQGRPQLALNESEALPLQDGYGLHPQLSRLKQLWDDGNLAIVNGVGNPNPVLSHFRSQDIWEAANFSTAPKSGWLGRYFDHACEASGNFDSTIGLDIRPAASLAFSTESNEAALTVQNPQFFDYLAASADLPTAPDIDDVFRRNFLSGLVDRGISTSGTLAYATSSLRSALSGSNEVRSAFEVAAMDDSETPFPDGNLGNSLRNIARYISGGLTSSTYFLSQGGYDTHARQYILDSAGRPLLGRHANLLGSLDSALGAFSTEMKRQGSWDRVVVMVYSEFSRKIIENGNSGSDHGAAGSVFVMGGQVQQGFYGEYPSLAPENRILNESMPMTTDFRQVYRTILERWYGLDPVIASQLLTVPVSEHPALNFLTP